MKLFIIFIFLFLYSLFGKAQVNLVPNPSFEEYTQCPSYFAQLNKTLYWYSPTLGDPDYYNSCDTGIVGVPVNGYGYQKAHLGIAYVGFHTYTSYDKNFREYIQNNLINILNKNKKYKVKFYLILANDSKFATGNIGVYFSDIAFHINSKAVLPYKPQIEIDSALMDTIKWICISSMYIAEGWEKFITIGNFKDSTHTQVFLMNGKQDAAYYYIDDVSVTLCDTQDTMNVKICPNDSTYLQNKFQTSSGFYTDSLKNQYGCDSIIITNLSVENYKFKNKDLIINEGDSVLINGKYRSQQGIYYDTLKTHASCDSIIITNLIIEHKLKVFPNPSSSGEITISYFTNNNSLVQFKLVDFIGREVMSINCGMKTAGDYSNQVNISELAAGIYLLIANINGEYRTIKINKL